MPEESPNPVSHPLDDVSEDELRSQVQAIVRDAVCVNCGTTFTTTDGGRRLCVWCKARQEVRA